jgi:hypothetical protein
LLPDGRFAFWLQRQWGYLQQMIDSNMNIHRRHGTATEDKPFTQRMAYRIMTDIAMGMHGSGCTT